MMGANGKKVMAAPVTAVFCADLGEAADIRKIIFKKMAYNVRTSSYSSPYSYIKHAR